MPLPAEWIAAKRAGEMLERKRLGSAALAAEEPAPKPKPIRTHLMPDDSMIRDIAAAMQIRRHELINEPLARIWKQLATTALVKIRSYSP